MIRKLAGEIQILCDGCGEESESYDSEEFHALIAAVTSECWLITRHNGAWNHKCPQCVREDSPLAAARAKFGIR